MIQRIKSPAASRLSHFKKGINLSHWYSQVYSGPGYVAEHFEHYLKDSDFELIKSMGFDHVRFPIGCEAMINDLSGMPAYVARISGAIKSMQGYGLRVIVDIHPETPFKEALAVNDEVLSSFVSFWKSFAKSLSIHDPDTTLFEILNEPCLNIPRRWDDIQARLVREVRAVAPLHTIVICGDSWSQAPQLLKIRVPDDDNLAANFHLYDPSSFTHQGAGWLPPWAQYTKGLSYPADRDEVNDMLKTVRDVEAQRHLREYGEMGWDKAAYERFIAPVISWAEEHGLPLMCNEFGVYRKFSHPLSRRHWLRDVTSLLEESGIGWTMWDYAGDFAVVDTVGCKRVPDEALLEALRLKSLSRVGM